MVRLFLAIAFVASCLAGCAPYPPARQASAEPPPGCGEVFDGARPAQRIQEAHLSLGKPVAAEQRVDYHSPCWDASHEYTADYDVFFVEFDDHGWLAAPGGDPGRMKWLMRQLDALVEKNGGTPLNLIVYTHGWHHSAAADDTNVNAFRSLLERAAHLEGRLAAGDGAAAAPPGKLQAKRRVVGVYIAWRGDSVLGPVTSNTSIWDRKLAAEEVAQGAVQELFAGLHNFYLAHACHASEASDMVIAGKQAPKPEAATCNDVRMLTIGHSFGALITYRALAGRLMANIAESPRRRASPDTPPRAHSFGDLVVLINPAFEGVHFEALARAAAERTYPTGLPARDELGAQLPILIILQSEGDMATGTFFTAFRRFTTIFNAGRGRAQSQANLHTVGWTDRYVTHRLETVPGFDPEHKCLLDCQLDTERAWRAEQKEARYAGFGQPRLALGNGLMLKQCGVDGHGKLACDGGGAPVSDGEGLAHPPFMPIWVVKTDPAIIRDHNDFLNARLVTFIRNMYYTVLEQSRAYP